MEKKVELLELYCDGCIDQYIDGDRGESAWYEIHNGYEHAEIDGWVKDEHGFNCPSCRAKLIESEEVPV